MNKRLTVKFPFNQPLRPVSLDDKEKTILKKIMTSMYLQEDVYYNGSGYQIMWFDILQGFLTKEEKTSGFGYLVTNFLGESSWNQLRYFFDDVFEIPKAPKGLFEWNLSHRETDEFKAFETRREASRKEVIRPYLEEWEDIKDMVLEPQS